MNTHNIRVTFEVPDDMTKEQLHEHLCKCVHEGYSDSQEELMNTVSDITLIPRHNQDCLNGVVEAALNRVMEDKKWLQDMADDFDPDWNIPNTSDAVFLELEAYICDVLASVK